MKTLFDLWTFYRNRKAASPILGRVLELLQRHDSTLVESVFGAVQSISPFRSGDRLTPKERIGLKLLDLTPEQEEIVTRMKEGKKFVCPGDLQPQS